MSEKEQLKRLIEDYNSPNDYEWAYNVEEFLTKTGFFEGELQAVVRKQEHNGDVFGNAKRICALLKRLYKEKFDNISIPPIHKRNQVFVAMMFSPETDELYSEIYEPVIQSLNYSAMRIDKKEFSGSIIGEITNEITDSVALIADLTGNRGGVYYEAGIAKGLQLCNHQIKLFLTCSRKFFDNEGIHFDLKGDNIIIYDNSEDLSEKLKKRMTALLKT